MTDRAVSLEWINIVVLIFTTVDSLYCEKENSK